MAYLVTRLAERGCITITETATVKDLAALLAKYNFGAVVVVNQDDKPTGIVSERDIVRHLDTSNSPISDTAISEIMSHDFISCGLETKSSELMELMTQNKIRHVPIMDNERLAGMVSIGDVVSRLIDIYAEENEQLRQYINS